MSDENMPLTELIEETKAQERQGFDDPFTTFTWRHWLEMQTTMIQVTARFQRAIEHREFRVALFAVMELQEVERDMLKEIGSWMTMDP